jgi:FAD:protein FMN transferase
VGLAPDQAAGARSWTTWGTYVTLGMSAGASLQQGVLIATKILEEIDVACSRFRADSELVRANGRAGRPSVVGPLLAAAVTVAVAAARETDGLVDPTLGHALVAVGYDRDIALLPGAAGDPAGVPCPPRSGAWREVVIDRTGEENTLTVPVGCALDLGATGKAWASDLVARSVADATGSDVVLSLGGDVSVVGSTTWPVEVTEVAGAAGPSVTVPLAVGGLATSTVRARRWVRGGRQRHHLLDPRTGEPTDGVWRTVSAYGRTAVAANTASTASIVLGDDAWDWLVARGVAARLVAQDGGVHRTPGWPEQAER